MGKFIEVAFSEICDFENGDRGKNYPSRNAYIDVGIPFFSAGNIADNKIDESSLNFISKERFDILGSGKVRKGDILFCLRGSLGKFAEIENDIDGGIASSLVIIRPSDKVNLGFLKLFLESHLCSEMIKKYDNGTAQPNLSSANLKKFKIPLPPLPEQQRIVAKLDGLFAKIDQAIGLLEENMTHTQALMGSVLDEEFGKLEKFNKPIMTFCKNPKKDMVGGPFGSNLKASEYVEKGYPIIRLQNVDRFNFKEKNIMFVTEEKAEFLSSHSYDSGDIVMTKLGDPLGKCCIVKDVLGVNKGVISSDIIRIRIDESKHYKPYVVAGINSEYFIKQLKSKTQGSTRPRVTLKEVRAMQLPMLKREDQVLAAERIDGILDLQSKVIETQTQKLNHLKALKSSLLDQAFKGDL